MTMRTSVGVNAPAQGIVPDVAATITGNDGIVTAIGVREWGSRYLVVEATYSAEDDKHDGIVAAVTALSVVDGAVKDEPEARERKFKGSSSQLAIALLIGGGAAFTFQHSDKAVPVALALAVVTFVLAILDDFVDRKDVNSEAFDKFLLPWLKSAVTAYAAVAAAILFWEKKKTTSRLDVVLTVAVGLAVTAIAAFVLIVFITALVKRLRST